MELKLSDEQYIKIWDQAYGKFYPTQGLAVSSLNAGRAAVDAVIAEVLPIVRGAIYDESQQGFGDGARRWVYMDQVNQVFARFTAPKDAAVEAEPYSVEVDRAGCEHCGHDRQWAIVFHNGKPDEIQLSTTFGDKEEAEWIAEEVNDAYQRGLRAADREVGR